MGFIDYHKTRRIILDGLPERIGLQTFWSDIEEGRTQIKNGDPTVGGQFTVVRHNGVMAGNLTDTDTLLVECLNLIFHQGKSRLDDQCPGMLLLVHDQGGNLEYGRLSGTGGSDDQSILAIQNAVDGFVLMLTQRADMQLFHGVFDTVF